MSLETRSRIRTPYAAALDLPPPYRLVTLREVGDAFAHATTIAAEAGAGTLVWVGRFDLVEFALVVEPDEPLRVARRTFYAGMAALADALVVHAPPEKLVAFDWPDAILVDCRLKLPGTASAAASSVRLVTTNARIVPVVAVVPWAIDGGALQPPLFDGVASRWFGALLVLIGLPILSAAVVRFVRQGHGTPAPVAPPQRLVVTGLYRYVRNPMYIAVVAMIVGQALIIGSRGILVFAIALALAFHWFVVLYEEPTLRRAFGEQYLAYRRRVPRWIPRLTPAELDEEQ